MVSGSTLDTATRLRDFCALIDEMRATLLRHDSKEEVDARNCDDDDDDDDDDERERLLRLLEDVMRKVKQLAEKDAAGLGRSGRRCSLGLSSAYHRASSEKNVKYSQAPNNN